MAWNEPGGSGNQDPWGHRKKEQGPPDLDDIIENISNKFNRLFGGGGGSQSDGGPSNGGNGLSWSAIGFLTVILLIIWSLFGFYTIQPAELGVVTQFGRYQRTTQQGLNWHWPYPIEEVQKVNVEQVRAVTHRALMLTQDENIVVIELVVQYRVKDAKDYLFNVADPDNTLHQATESALREIVGTSNMDAVLTSERARVAVETKVLIQDIVDRYQTGLGVTSVNMQNAQPPEAVQAAFADVIKAREDQERSKNKADAYSNQIIERAKGTADRLREEAHAYKAKVITLAEGEAKRFLSVLTAYEKAPNITRQRLYLETIEEVLSKTSKVMIDLKNGNQLMVLPLDQLLNQSSLSKAGQMGLTSINPEQLSPSLPKGDGDPRSRGER